MLTMYSLINIDVRITYKWFLQVIITSAIDALG